MAFPISAILNKDEESPKATMRIQWDSSVSDTRFKSSILDDSANSASWRFFHDLDDDDDIYESDTKFSVANVRECCDDIGDAIGTDSSSESSSCDDPEVLALSPTDSKGDAVVHGFAGDTLKFLLRTGGIGYGPSFVTSSECIQSSNGFCYLNAVKDAYKLTSRLSLGKAPPFSWILASPRKIFLNHEELRKFYVTGISPKFHLVRSNQGFPFLSALAIVAKQTKSAPYTGTMHEYINTLTFPKSMLSTSYMNLVSPVCTLGASNFEEYVKGLFLDSQCKVPDNDGFRADLSIMVKSSAMLDNTAKNRLRMFEAVGDAALTRILARVCLTANTSPQQYQAARSSCTTNANLSRIFVKVFDISWFQFPSGVNPGTGNVGAKAVEAILGFLDFYGEEHLVYATVVEWGILQLANDAQPVRLVIAG